MNSSHEVLAALRMAHADLVSAMRDGHWVGQLSSSALATATAISAFGSYLKCGKSNESRRPAIEAQLQRGLEWMVRQANADGGFGDTDKSKSNISTTLLAIAAVKLANKSLDYRRLVARAERFVEINGSIAGIQARYGRDKTFAVPILANAALAGIVDWAEVAALPFEAACLPQSWYRFVRLPVVSYAIPALVAIGHAKFHFDPPQNPLIRWIRARSRGRSLRVLAQMQPASGGYLEAIPLTSFVVMSLAQSGRADFSVTSRGLDFLLASQRDDGSWPIDTNLATWATSLASLAVASAKDFVESSSLFDLDWILKCQHRERHPFTGSAPGGWGWSDLSGAVPDADDTPAALLALKAFETTWRTRPDAKLIEQQIESGKNWLLGLQNRDGGWPTFCRGWGKLPFDRSGSDLTAHAIRALVALRDQPSRRVDRAVSRGLTYLSKQQRPDGSWLPLWFGNQDNPDDENPVYGTCKVLCAFRDLKLLKSSPAQRAAQWLLQNQNADGGWGGGTSIRWSAAELGKSSVEETALATEIMTEFADRENFSGSMERGARWLVSAVRGGFHAVPSPIGLYFAKLWYYEDVYPLIFTVSALSRVAQLLKRAT